MSGNQAGNVARYPGIPKCEQKVWHTLATRLVGMKLIWLCTASLLATSLHKPVRNHCLTPGVKESSVEEQCRERYFRRRQGKWCWSCLGMQDLFSGKSKNHSHCTDQRIPMQCGGCSEIRQAGQGQRPKGTIMFPGNDSGAVELV